MVRVLNLDPSIMFYRDAFGLAEAGRFDFDEFTLVLWWMVRAVRLVRRIYPASGPRLSFRKPSTLRQESVLACSLASELPPSFTRLAHPSSGS